MRLDNDTLNHAVTRCVIVDDEELARELIEAHLSQLNGYEVVASCSSALEASSVLQAHNVDLLFLDIEMPVLKGTEFYKNLVHKPKVIFTTAYRDYAVDGFELDAVDYLLKPIVFSRFFQAIERFAASQGTRTDQKISASSELEQRAKPVTDYLFVRKDRKQIKVVLDDILYIQGLKDYLKIVMPDGSHIVKQKMSTLERQLGPTFIRVHRSYIVNHNKITAYTNHDIEIAEHEIPIGDSHRAKLMAQLEPKRT